MMGSRDMLAIKRGLCTCLFYHAYGILMNSMDNSLKKIISSGLSSLSNIFSSDKGSVSVLGVDIGSSSVKLVQLKTKRGKAILETYGSVSLGPYGSVPVGQVTNLPPESIAQAIIDLLKECNATTRFGVVAIPSSSSLIFTISLPGKVTESDLATIVPTEARKYIPVPISEITLDWFMIPREATAFAGANLDASTATPATTEPKVEVLVVAIHNETLSRYQDILKQSELQSDSFEMEIFGNIRSSFEHDVAPVLLMDFGASKTKLCIVEAGIVRVFHVVNRGSQDITHNISASLNIPFEEAEALKRSVGLNESANPEVASIVKLSTDYIFADTNSVVLAYEKKYNVTISKIILSGGGSMLGGLVESTSAVFNRDVVLSNPFSKVEAPAFLDPILQNIAPEFAIAVGVALRNLQ
jgi:type IV pilus assembly protein PilM